MDSAAPGSGSEPGAPPAACSRLARELDRLAKLLLQVQRSAQSLAAPDAWKSTVDARKQLDKLRAFDPGNVRVETDVSEAVQEARTAIERRLEARRASFWPALQEAAAARGLRCERLTQEPFEVRLGRLTALIDLGQERATLCYAREPVERRDDLDADALLASVARLEQAFLERAGTAAERFEKLATAYRMARAAKRLPAEEPVDLVDLLPLYALCSLPEAKRRTARLDVAGEKAQLAFDLALLRQEGALTSGELRIVLSSATGRSASNKKNVLYLENANGEGQYWLGLALRRAAGGNA